VTPLSPESNELEIVHIQTFDFRHHPRLFQNSPQYRRCLVIRRNALILRLAVMSAARIQRWNEQLPLDQKPTQEDETFSNVFGREDSFDP
jgi:hypothetical protein